ncbi:hypothetical protein CERZMDRAFT_51358 [Cercospora zeae-maydis SCOH1-5]|uniref:Uncharacterized protein n=1 Tax=Cercospora zeae-maydis SCOH1-5 TaxID=717836 RepID=A0A6A6F0Q0_9PEZI|nr:hypothetical protein CERZMDRAFT_51358 [Cercospora zeae-maydis SCOH1-5]
MLDRLIAVLLLLALSIFGFKSLHLFATANGLLTRLEKCITDGTTPGGKPLRTWTTNGRFPGVDIQLRAVAIFLMIFCEDLEHADADLVGFSFAANWGVSWLLIVLESLREYSRYRFMSWITIPGILIFNQSNAVFTPLYLAIRLAVASRSSDTTGLEIHTEDVQAIRLSFFWGYILPLTAMAMPGLLVKRFNTKHIIASWYQQWNLFISLIHFGLVWWWRSSPSDTPKQDAHAPTDIELLHSLRPLYQLTMLFAAGSLWVPILISISALISGSSRRRRLGLRSIFVPPSPWSKIQCSDTFEGGKWLLQWDGIIGSIGSAVWALALFNDARVTWAPEQSLMSWWWTAMRYLALGGPIAVATGFLWERDALVFAKERFSLLENYI